MIINLDDEYRKDYRPMEMCFRWRNGVEIKWDKEPFSIDDYPIAFVKGDYISQIETHHTSISGTEFMKFAEQCSGNVYIGTTRLIFEREVVIGFDTEADAMAFKLIFI